MGNPRSPDWIRARSGPLTTRRMTAALDRIAVHLGGATAELALGKVATRRDPFAVLVACLISLRTRDEVTDVVAPRLLAVAPTPAELGALTESAIAELIFPAGFYRTKARTLRELGATLVADHDAKVPDTMEALLALRGVGRKTANLVLDLGHGKPGLCVDTHVHRISNRMGYVDTQSPDDTEQVLRVRLPQRYWHPVNELLVGFGRTECKPLSPHCSRCPVADLCLRVAVGRAR